MNQHERATNAVRELHGLLPALNKGYEELRLVVGQAQNGPPDGEGDGSIHPEQWERFKQIERALQVFLRSFPIPMPKTSDGF
jgi:hypothetical protein